MGMDEGKNVGYASAAFGFFLTIYGIVAPSVVGCVGCDYRRQQQVGLVPGFRIAGWIVYAFANLNCFGIWCYYGLYESDVVDVPPSVVSIVWIIIYYSAAYVLLCIDTEISRADIGFGRTR